MVMTVHGIMTIQALVAVTMIVISQLIRNVVLVAAAILQVQVVEVVKHVSITC